MMGFIAKSCLKGKQHIANPYRHYAVIEKKTARQLLADNLAELMRTTPQMSRQGDVAKRTTGAISGRKVGQTTVSLMLRPNNISNIKAPKLDKIDEVAAAFGLEAWQLLLNKQTVGEHIYEMLMSFRARSDKPLRAIQGHKLEREKIPSEISTVKAKLSSRKAR